MLIDPRSSGTFRKPLTGACRVRSEEVSTRACVPRIYYAISVVITGSSNIRIVPALLVDLNTSQPDLNPALAPSFSRLQPRRPESQAPSSEMARYSREGLTIDVVARALRTTTLNPQLMIPISAIFHWGVTATDLHPVRSAAYVCALLGTVLTVNEWLNKWSANNWEGGNRPPWDWDKEIVLVTGGSSGIGASIAQQLIFRNSRTMIVIVDFTPLTWTPKPGANVFYYKCDLSDAGAIRALVTRIRAEVGHPTVLVNNAGTCRGATVMDGSYGDVELTMRTNLIAPFLLAKEVLPHMVKMNHGHIVNVGSVSSLFPPANVADYSATKAGITALHEVCQTILQPCRQAARGIQKLVISAGYFDRCLSWNKLTGRRPSNSN